MVRQSGTVIAILVICAAATRPNVMTSLGVEPMGQIIRAKDKAMDKDLPGTEFDDAQLANQFGTMPDGFEAFDLEGFVKEVHHLYFDAAKPFPSEAGQQENQYQQQYVHFHNWDHGRNVFAFTKWYVNRANSGISPENQFLLMLAALAHDVMHPGTPNRRDIVEKTFLHMVNNWKQKTGVLLKHYAEELLESIGGEAISDTIRGALGCGQVPCVDGNDDEQTVTDVLLDRAPQEVLHAWLTIRLLINHGFPNTNTEQMQQRLQTVAIPILMTSIVAHFKVLFDTEFKPHPELIEKHVDEEAQKEIPKLGLLLHFFDMGYICQSSTSPSAGIRFAARYLVESNNAPFGLPDMGTVAGGQVRFGQNVVGKYLEDLHNFKVIDSDVFKELKDGLESFVGSVSEAAKDPVVLKSALPSFLKTKQGAVFQHELQQEILKGFNLRTQAYKTLSESLALEKKA
mmetsp:Transcript_31661/g.54879  ORF Transcript_31661/g.54879 Transcript_31661/m.54879 type:complete len:456 (+) Transcript_31661:84-1451(+)